MNCFTNCLANVALLAMIVLVSGCSPDNASEDSSAGSGNRSGEHVHADGSTHDDHSVEGHAHAPGPHGGTIVDWGGGKFHVELTVGHELQQATVYIYGPDEKTPLPIDAETIMLNIKQPSISLALQASPEADDPDGKSSRFIGTDDGFKKPREYEGSLSGLVEGTPYSGSFSEDSHDHEH